MKTLISIGSVAVSALALNLIPVQQANAIDLAFTSVTTTTEAFYNSVGYAGYGTGTPPTVNSKTVGDWTSEGYNMLLSNGANLLTNSNVATEDGSALNFYGSTLPAPVGTHFIAADSAYLSGRISQNLTDLEIGATYTLSYYQAAAQQYERNPDGTPTGNYDGATNDAWTVNVGGAYIAPTYSGGADYGSNLTTGGFTGGTTHDSPTMNLASKGAAGTQTVSSGAPVVNGWQQDSFAFTATSSTQTLSFLAKGGPNGKPPFALLGGVSYNKIPEPGTYVGTLLGLGILGTVVKSRLTKKKLGE
jgi:hypothetical protein